MDSLDIACPDCGTRYRTNADAIGPNGRTVRCARCEETWFVPAVGVVPQTDPDQLALRDLEADPISAPAPVGAATPVRPIDASPDASLGAVESADVTLRNQADAQKLARRRRTIRLIWIVTALVALAAIVAAYLNRQAIVNRIPQAATLYQGLGMDVYAGGLDIAPPTAKTTLVDGVAVVTVTSEVRNLSGQPQPLPLIELSLHDEDGAQLAQWFVEPDRNELDARGRYAFTTVYSNPPEATASLRYRLVGEAGS